MRGDFPAAAACLRPHQSPAVTAVPHFVTYGDISPRNGENLSRPGEAFCPTATVVRKKALVFQGENLERREPVKIYTGHPWYHSPCCTVRYSHFARSAKTANRCPCNGGRPSEPTCPFSSAAQGPVSEALCTRLAPPGGSLHAEERSFYPRQRICALLKVR